LRAGRSVYNVAMRLLAAVLLLTLSACFMSRSTVNEPLRRAQFEQLHPGTTTAKEVVELLGAPNEVVQLGTRSAYRYDFTNLKREGFTVIVFSALNEDARADRAWLFFDAHDVLTHFGSTFEADKARYQMPWSDENGG
jgi:outer membrane protein assembly factor BamE (lipoprotein component of BamABCDE complex)